VRILETRVERGPDVVRVVGSFVRAGARSPEEAYFAFPAELQGFVADTADPFVPALLVPCLERGEDLEVVPPISPRLLGRLQRIQDVLLSFHPRFRPIAISAAPRRSGPTSGGTAVATLFSCGVDSFYTLLKAQRGALAPPLTHLLFMRGLEQPLSRSRGVDDSLAWVRQIADQTGLGVISGETNLRDLFGLNYELYYHGAALIAAGLALCRGLERLLVPSTFSYGQLKPWGSHPLLDELWSTECLEVIHDGAEARRVDKLERLVARDPLALSRLRVCLQNDAGATNCGRCRKCARTLLILEILGAAGRAVSFPRRSVAALAADLRTDHEVFLQEALGLAERRGRADVTVALRRARRQGIRRKAVRALLESFPLAANLLGRLDRLRAHLRARRGRPPQATARIEVPPVPG
jgi:hypothetical protein